MHLKPVRYQNQRCLHFITFSCYRRMKLLDTPAARETFESELERVRRWYGCCVAGYVVMPEPGAPFLAPFARSGAFRRPLPTLNQRSVEFSPPTNPNR